MGWLAGLFLAVIVLSTLILGRERLARRRRNRLIRSSIETSQRVTRSQRSEMRGDSHHDTIIGMISKSATRKPNGPSTTKRRARGARQK